MGTQPVTQPVTQPEPDPEPEPELGEEGDEMPEIEGGATDWIDKLSELPDEDVEQAEDPNDALSRLGYRKPSEEESVPEAPEEAPEAPETVPEPIETPGEPEEPEGPEKALEEPERPKGRVTAQELEDEVEDTISTLQTNKKEDFKNALEELKQKIKGGKNYKAHLEELVQLLQMARQQKNMEQGEVDDLMAHHYPVGDLLRNESLLRKVKTKNMSFKELKDYYVNLLRD